MSIVESPCCIVVLGAGNQIKSQLDCWLGPLGWFCLQVRDGLDISIPDGKVPALFIINDPETEDLRSTWISQIRAMSGLASGTPIILATGAGSPPPRGTAAMLPLPLDRDATLDLIAHWCGPLEDHAFRDLGNPIYRLVRLGGQTAADGMIARFGDQLRTALAYLEDPETTSFLPHHIAGLAGMLGFDELSRIWRGIDSGDSIDFSSAKACTSAILSQIEGRELRA